MPLAWDRFARDRFAPVRFAPVRFAPRRSAPVRSARDRFAPRQVRDISLFAKLLVVLGHSHSCVHGEIEGPDFSRWSDGRTSPLAVWLPALARPGEFDPLEL